MNQSLSALVDVSSLFFLCRKGNLGRLQSALRAASARCRHRRRFRQQLSCQQCVGHPPLTSRNWLAGPDPKASVAFSRSNDRSTLETVAGRTRRGNQSLTTAVVRGWQPAIGTRSRVNGCIRKSRTGAPDPQATLVLSDSPPRSSLSARRVTNRWARPGFRLLRAPSASQSQKPTLSAFTDS